MEPIYIVSGTRTAIGDFGGSLKDFAPAELAKTAEAKPAPVPSRPQVSKPAPAPAARAASAAPVASGPSAGKAQSDPLPGARDDEATLRALLLRQKADGLFDADLGATLAAVAVLVGRGQTPREGLFRAELRRTAATLRKLLGEGLSGDALLQAALALALGGGWADSGSGWGGDGGGLGDFGGGDFGGFGDF